MQLTLDNLDGLGPQDYTSAIAAGSKPGFRLERTLNAPSILEVELVLLASSLPVPVRRARVIATADAGTVLFTGYLATEAVAVYAGEASAGPVYRYSLRAVSDEWLLDQQSGAARAGTALGARGGSVAQALAQRLGAGPLNLAGLAGGSLRTLGVFDPVASASWSVSAGQAAGASFSAYRAVAGALAMTGVAAVVHTFSDGDGSLHLAGLQRASVRELANDVTVTGAMEPGVYWTEVFLGDGTTAVFPLTGEPAAVSGEHRLLLEDGFTTPAIDTATWAVTDPGSHLLLTGTGLTLNGGNGFDGQTMLSAYDTLELGGTCVVELGGVQLNAGSAGVLGGLYAGVCLQANCVAGFNVRQSGGQTLLTPLVNGVEAGASLTVLAGHSYTLRLHLHSSELLRVKQTFYAYVQDASGAGVRQFGGGLVDAPLALVFEVRDSGASSNTPVTVLYDGVLPTSPAQATLVAVNSLQLFGVLGAVKVARTGTCWIVSTNAQTGTSFTRLAGLAAEGVDFQLAFGTLGTVTFFPGRVPLAGDRVTVSYRGRQRAVARVADTASVAREAAGGAAGSARWTGHVVRPPARSAEDCEFAAQAILSFAANRSAALSGSYTAVNPRAFGSQDLWPGDLLALSVAGSGVNGIIRRVKVEGAGAAPEALTYTIAFANDWAEGLGLALSETVAKDAVLPSLPLPLTGLPAGVPANLQQLAITSVSGNMLNVDGGMLPPAGGGFEVRRREGAGDLVLNSPVRSFQIPLAVVGERFFVRMFSGSTPAIYSRRAVGIVSHVPVS